MALENRSPNERNKLIAAVALGAIALLVLARFFFGGSSSTSTTKKSTRSTVASRTSTPVTLEPVDPAPVEAPPAAVSYEALSLNLPPVKRNIFAFYVPPPPPPVVEKPTPPPPPAPLTLVMVDPLNVYATSGEFNMQVTGDKFTSDVKVFIDEREMPTTFVNAQTLKAKVPGNLIAHAGGRNVVIRNSDGSLYSNPMTLNVIDPPKPQYSYVGILGRAKNNDIAILKDPRKNELINVKRGDVVGGQWKVTSISERTIEFIETRINIKQSLPLIDGGRRGGTITSVQHNEVPAPDSAPEEMVDEEEERQDDGQQP
jgi:hypothetical protein